MPKESKKGVRRKSNCWQFFTKTGKGGSCRLCEKEIISNGNTTNLLNHMKRKHTIQWESSLEINDKFKKFKSKARVDDSSEEDDDDEEEDEEQSAELHRSTTETQQTHGLAYQSADGRTVIWLHPDVQVEQLNAAGFQPQITLMEQPTDNAQEATTLNQKEGQDIVAIAGEVIPQEDITVQTSEDTRNLDEMNSNMSSSLIVDSEAQKDEVIVTNSGEVCQVVHCVTVGEEFQEKSVINSNPKVSHVNRSPSTFTVSSSPQKVMVTHASSSHKSKKKFPKKKCRHSSDNEDSSQSKPSKNGHHKSDSQAEESTSKARRCCEPQREDSFDQFGKYIATLLRNLPSRRTACKLQKEMINWVLKEQMLFED